MGNLWTDEQLSKKLREKNPVASEDAGFGKVWRRVEDRLGSRNKPFRGRVLWKPWAHPGGWMAVAACLGVTIGGFQYQRNQADNNDLDSWLITLSDPTAYAASGPDELNVSVLVEEPSTPSTDVLLSGEDQPEPPPLL